MSIWQTQEWQDMLKKSNQVEKTIILENIFIEKRLVSLGEFGLFALGVDLEKLPKYFFNKIKNICKEEKALFFQLENIEYTDFEEKSLENFEKKYYKKFITPFTALLDLTLTEDEILRNMKPKGRYNIRLAVKKGVKVFEAEKSEENVKIFYDLMNETTARDNFSGNSFYYYKIFLNELKNSKLLFAEFEGKIISAGIFIFTKDIGIYYYGASTSDKKFRNIMSPYLLQWEAIKISKKNGCKIYDFLGIAGEGEEKSPLAGVTDFKLKFTKNGRKVSESFLYVNKKLKYFFIKTLRTLKK